MRITLVPGLSTLSPDDEPLQAATAELIADLRDVDDVRVTEEDRTASTGHKGQSTGHKGQWQDLVLALGGPSVVAGVVSVFRLWLSRDRRRSLTLVATRPGEEPLRIEISGEHIAEETVRDAVLQLLDD